MLDLKSQLARIALTGRLTYLYGATGTGKELVARTLHESSPRSREPFVTVNCAALPDELFESELFGHAQGAYTGANRRREGLVAEAGNGTLFLDEINSLSPRAQAKLLRFLESGELRPVGSDRARRSGAWVITASNEDLQAQVRSGGFRSDLYWRLQVLVVKLPTLHDRGRDVLLLAEHFRRSVGGDRHCFTREAEQAMLRHAWPGNVRELRHRVETAVLMANTRQITASDLRLDPSVAPSPSTILPGPAVKQDLWDLVANRGMTLAQATRHCERMLIEAALEAEDGNRTRAAGRLGIHVRTIFKKLSP